MIDGRRSYMCGRGAVDDFAKNVALQDINIVYCHGTRSRQAGGGWEREMLIQGRALSAAGSDR
jgi:hypothetical protein